GWPAIFVLGGVLPLAMVPLLALHLPESIALSRAARPRNLVAALFRDGHAPYTALLWAMNLLNLLSNFLILLWTPAILHSSGAIPSQAIFATSMFGLGIILGALLTASLADRLGVERVLTYTVAFGALCVLSIGLLRAPLFGAVGDHLWRGTWHWGMPGWSHLPIGKDLSFTYPLDRSRLGPGLGACRRHCWAAPGRRTAWARFSGEGALRRGRGSALCRGGADGDP